MIQRIASVIAVIAIVGLAGSTAYFYKEYRDLKIDPQKSSQDEVESLVREVGKLIVLPTDEQPTVATVSDPEALKDQPFFVNAKSGYKVLIYAKAAKAILYDPVGKKIVEVAPVNIGDTAPAPQGRATTTSTSTRSTR